MVVAVFLAVALTSDPTEAWIETVNTGADALTTVQRDSIYLPNEITPSRTVPTGRIDGSRGYIFWPDGIMSEPQLTCIDLTDHKVLWRQPVSMECQALLFTPQHVITSDEQRGRPDGFRLKLRWFDRESGAPRIEKQLDPGVWFRMLDQRCLFFNNNEIHDAETGERISTLPVKTDGNGLVIGETLTGIVLESTLTGQQVHLRKVNLSDGRLICDHDLSERLGVEYLTLLACDERSAAVVAEKNTPYERRLLCLSLKDGTENWNISLPPYAPVRFTNAPSSLVTQQRHNDGIALRTGLDVDWVTGSTTFPNDRPSPRSRFDWFVRTPADLLGIRLFHRSLLGLFVSVEGETYLTCIDPESGRQKWATPLTFARTGVVWMPELRDDPRYAVFPSATELNVVDAETGVVAAIHPRDLGLPYELKTFAEMAAPMAEEPLPTAPSTTLSQLRRVMLALAGLAVVLLWSFRGRMSGPRPS